MAHRDAPLVAPKRDRFAARPARPADDVSATPSMRPPSILIVNATTPTAISLQRAATRSKARPDVHALAHDPSALPSELRALYRTIHAGDVCAASTLARVVRQTQPSTVIITVLDGGLPASPSSSPLSSSSSAASKHALQAPKCAPPPVDAAQSSTLLSACLLPRRISSDLPHAESFHDTRRFPPHLEHVDHDQSSAAAAAAARRHHTDLDPDTAGQRTHRVSSLSSSQSPAKRRRAPVQCASARCAEAVAVATRGRPVRIVLVSTIGAGGSQLRVGWGIGTAVSRGWLWCGGLCGCMRLARGARKGKAQHAAVCARARRRAVRECDAAEMALVRAMDAPSTRDRLMIVRPTVLTARARRGDVHAFTDDMCVAPAWRVCVDDVADWIVAQICSGDADGYFGQCVNLTASC